MFRKYFEVCLLEHGQTRSKTSGLTKIVERILFQRF